jgi:hypothetical protein
VGQVLVAAAAVVGVLLVAVGGVLVLAWTGGPWTAGPVTEARAYHEGVRPLFAGRAAAVLS